MIRNFQIFLIVTFFVACGSWYFFRTSTTTQKTETRPSLFSTMEKEAPLELTIETDMAGLMAQREIDVDQTAFFSWSNPEGAPVELEGSVKLRGKTRRNICSFPPLKLKFNKEQLNDKGVANYSSLKLVTHCIEDEQLVLKEYLTYKMYNELSDKSFKVQLVKVNYVDFSGTYEPVEQYGFLLENNKEMAARLEGDLYKSQNERLGAIDADQYRLLTVFQYMIGNTDWNLAKSHNIKLVKPAGSSAPVPVPYDFDFSGIVDAPYATPHPQLPIQAVTQRFFQWRGKSAEGFEPVLELFQAKKATLYNLCYNFDLLNEESKNEMIDYLESFYEIIEHANDGESLMVAVEKAQEIIS